MASFSSLTRGLRQGHSEKIAAGQLPPSVVNVTSLWAPKPSGDVTGASDSAAVQALVDQATAAGGGYVYLWPGTYWGNLTLKKNVRLYGAGKYQTTWKSPASFSGTLLLGLNFATLTGKTKATGDYLLGAPGVAIVGMTVDGNAHAANGIRLWGQSMFFDDLIVQNCTGDNIVTEFTDVDSFANLANKLDGRAGTVSSISAGGNGWTHRGPHDTAIDQYVAYNCGGWACSIDAVTNSYTGGVMFKYFNSFLNTTGSCQVLNNGVVEILQGALSAANVGTGLDLSAAGGSSKIDCLIGGHTTGVHLRGTGHTINIRATNNPGDVVVIDGPQKCSVRIFAGANNTNLFKLISEAGPNYFEATADIGAVQTLFDGVHDVGSLNSQSTFISSANGAGGDFSRFKIPTSTITLPTGFQPVLPPLSNQLEAEGYTGETYSASITSDASDAHQNRLITVTDATAFTINQPTNLRTGQVLRYVIDNESGGAMGAITWSGFFRMTGAFTNPANTKVRTITFIYMLGSLLELARTSADI